MTAKREIVPAALLALVGGAALWVTGDSYTLRLATLAGTQALMVLGYQLVFGHLGALSLAQGALFGIGGYAAALLTLSTSWGAALSLPAGMLAAALPAAAVGWIVLRLETHYFALATLALAQLVHLAIVNLEGLTGGANGLAGIPGLAPLGVGIGRGWPAVLFVWSLVAVVGWLSLRWRRGLAGTAIDMAREHPLAAASVGIDVASLRFAAFVAGAGLAGLAGAIQVHVVGVVSPDLADFPLMVGCLIATVLGGRRHPLGAALGAILLVFAPEWFRFLENRHLIAFGLLTLLVVVVLPEGLANLVARLASRVAPVPRGQAVAPTALPSARVWEDWSLRVEHASKRFGGVVALDDVSLALAPGEAVALIGPNGSGKTTLVNALSGIVRADSGRLTFGGIDVVRASPAALSRAGLARSFQHAELPATASALDAVAVAASARGVPDGQARATALAALTRVGARAVATTPCGSLAAGDRRPVEIARAIAGSPRLVLLDEPGAGLSAAEKASLALALRSLVNDGATLLVVDHDLSFLETFADRLICLDRGRVVADGPFAPTRRHPAVIAAYVGDAGGG